MPNAEQMRALDALADTLLMGEAMQALLQELLQEEN